MGWIKALSAMTCGVIAFAWAGLTQAQAPRGPPCAPRSEVIGHLQGIYGEKPVGSGLSEGGYLLEVYAGPAGSWTVFATTPDGMSCLISAGSFWEPRPAPELYAGR